MGEPCCEDASAGCRGDSEQPSGDALDGQVQPTQTQFELRGRRRLATACGHEASEAVNRLAREALSGGTFQHKRNKPYLIGGVTCHASPAPRAQSRAAPS